jgi:hypothetical protein
MKVDLNFEVSELTFDIFERRKARRENNSFYKIYKAEQISIEFDLGIEVREVSFDQFERRKVPRENRPQF